MGCWGAKLELKTSHALIQRAHLDALRATQTYGRYNMGHSVHSSTCHMLSTMGSWLVRMPGVASSLPFWMLG